MPDEALYTVDGREVVVTASLHVRCDGGADALGHPIEYMTLEKEGEVICKYCGRRFVHEAHPQAAGIRAAGRSG